MKVVDNWAFEALPPVHHDVTSDVPEDTGMARFVEQQLRQLGDAYKRILALSEAELDGRFVSIRTRETGLGNFICDVGMFAVTFCVSSSLLCYRTGEELTRMDLCFLVCLSIHYMSSPFAMLPFTTLDKRNTT